MSRVFARLAMIFLLLATGICVRAQLPVTSAPAANLPANVKPEDALWLSAQESLRFRQFQDARLKFEQFALKYRQDARVKEALFYQGLCQLNLGQEFQALTIWNRLVQEMDRSQSPALRLTLEQLVLFHERQGGPDHAKMLEKLRLAFPDDEITAVLHRRAAEKKMTDRDYAAAVNFYQVLGRRQTEPDRRNLELARKLAGEGGGDPAAALKLADASLARNELDLAVGLYETVLKQCPASLAGEARTKLGWCHHLQQRYPEAEKLYRQTIESGPAKDEWRGQSRWQLIVLLAGPKNNVKAAQALCTEQAREYAGEFKGEQALFTRAWLFWTRKEWAAAQTAFNELILAHPETARRPPIQGYLRDCEAGLAPGKGKLRGIEGNLIRK